MYVIIANGDEAIAIPIVNGYEKVINVTFSPFISIREHTLVLWIAKYPVPVAQKFSNLARLCLSISLYSCATKVYGHYIIFFLPFFYYLYNHRCVSFEIK